MLVNCPTVRVVDGADRLTLHLDCDGQPRSTALWRNLRGWPEPAAEQHGSAPGRAVHSGGPPGETARGGAARPEPYRSVGVEPMLGAAFDLADAGPGDAAVVPPAGEVRWRLTISAHRSTGGHPR